MKMSRPKFQFHTTGSLITFGIYMKWLFIQNVKGTFIGMSESRRGIISGAETAPSLPCDPRKTRRQRHIGRHACGIVITNAGCRRRRKERKRQRVGVSKMKGSGARNALRIWIRGEWGDRRQVRGVRTSCSEKDPAEKRLESG